jgi:hypothetical protein
MDTMESLRSSETWAFTRATRRNIPEEGILHSNRRENCKSYKYLSRLKHSHELVMIELNQPEVYGAHYWVEMRIWGLGRSWCYHFLFAYVVVSRLAEGNINVTKKGNQWNIIQCKMWGFHGGDYEECRLLGCYVVCLLWEPTFRRNVATP